jgi:hypothetical protein
LADDPVGPIHETIVSYHQLAGSDVSTDKVLKDCELFFVQGMKRLIPSLPLKHGGPKKIDLEPQFLFGDTVNA